MKKYILLEISDCGPLTVSPDLTRVTDASGMDYYGQWGGRVITEDEIGKASDGVDLIKALSVAIHKDAAIAAVTGEPPTDKEQA